MKPIDILRELTDSLDFCEITVINHSVTEIVFRVSDGSRAADLRFTEEGLLNREFVRRTIDRTVGTFRRLQ